MPNPASFRRRLKFWTTILSIVLQRLHSLRSYILVDTTAALEAFLWLPHGKALLTYLGSKYPTIIAFLLDSFECSLSPALFLSNIFYAFTIFQSSLLPLLLVCNKMNLKDATFVKNGMTNLRSLRDTWATTQSNTRGGYIGSLKGSLNLIIADFERHIDVSPLSAMLNLDRLRFIGYGDRAS